MPEDPQLVPVFIPVSPDRPLQPVPLTRSQALTVFDPNTVTPYVQNLTFSITRTLNKNLTLDLERQFAWQVEGRNAETAQVPDSESGLEIVIRK